MGDLEVVAAGDGNAVPRSVLECCEVLRLAPPDKAERLAMVDGTLAAFSTDSGRGISFGCTPRVRELLSDMSIESLNRLIAGIVRENPAEGGARIELTSAIIQSSAHSISDGMQIRIGGSGNELDR